MNIKEEVIMDSFLEFLAQRKYSLYHVLNIAVPQAYTNQECYARIVSKTRYLEVLDIIQQLPLEQQKVVESRFEEMKF